MLSSYNSPRELPLASHFWQSMLQKQGAITPPPLFSVSSSALISRPFAQPESAWWDLLLRRQSYIYFFLPFRNSWILFPNMCGGCFALSSKTPKIVQRQKYAMRIVNTYVSKGYVAQWDWIVDERYILFLWCIIAFLTPLYESIAEFKSQSKRHNYHIQYGL